MSFAEGFASTFAPTFAASYKAAEEFERELFKTRMDYWNKKQESYLKSKNEDAIHVRNAKALETEYGLPEGSWQNLHGWLASGRNIEKVREDLESGVFKVRTAPSAPATPAKKTTDDQTTELGLDDNEEVVEFSGTTAKTPAPANRTTTTTTATTPKSDDKSGNIFSMEGANARRNNRVQSAVESSVGGTDVYNQVLAGYTSPVTATGAITFERLPKNAKDGYLQLVTRSPEYQNGDPKKRQELLLQADRAFSPDGAPKTVAAAAVSNLLNSDEYKNADPKKRNDLLIGLNDALEAGSRAGKKGQILNENSTPEALEAGIAVATANGDENEVKRLTTIRDAKIGALSTTDLRGPKEPTFGRDASGKLVKAMRTKNGVLVDESGKKLDGVRELAGEEKVSVEKGLGFLNQELKARVDATGTIKAFVADVVELDALAKKDGGVLLSSTGLAGTAVTAVRNVRNVVDIIDEYIKDKNLDPNKFVLGEADKAEINRRLAAANLPEGSRLDERLRNYNDFQSKALDLVFRAGGLRGASGTAMSNKDFDNLKQIILRGSSYGGFSSNLRRFTTSLVREFDYKAEAYRTDPRVTGIQEIAEQKDMSLLTGTLVENALRDNDRKTIEALKWARGYEGGIANVTEIPQSTRTQDGQVDVGRLVSEYRLGLGDFMNYGGKTYVVVRDRQGRLAVKPLGD